MTKSAKEERFIQHIEGLTPKGQAFLTHNGNHYVFPGFLPGDKIEFFVNEEGRAKAGELIDPSPDRVKPDCFFHGPCGGCDLLELSEKARRKEKQAMINRCLDRIPDGKKAFVKPFHPSREIIRYLPRLRLHQSRNYKDRQSGFLGSEAFSDSLSGGIVPVTSCALITKPLNKRLVAARKILDQIPICIDSLQLMASSSDRSDRVTGHVTMMKGKPFRQFRVDLEKVMRTANLKGLSIADSTGKMKEVMGSVSVTGLIATGDEEGPYQAEPSFFVQGNIFQNENLIRTVLDFCKVNKTTPRIVEGFAGAGNFTIPLASHGAMVQAVESHPGAVRTAMKNISNTRFASRIEFIQDDAIKALLRYEPEPDVLLIDPPRTGIPSIERVVKKLMPGKIVYVFCDLDSMAKDSRKIVGSGYKLTQVAGLDLYPRTHHVEVVCLFEKAIQ